MPAEWPVELRGVTETVVATLGPNDRWNVAALGVFAGEPASARTWGRTRTRRNFAERGGGYVQFTRDPVDFVEAACMIRERDEPILESADAWARVDAERRRDGETEGTRWIEWELRPREAAVERRTVPTINRGHAAVVEATVAASRLGVAGYDDDVLSDRLEYFEDVVDRCGGDREREAFDRLLGTVDR